MAETRRLYAERPTAARREREQDGQAVYVTFARTQWDPVLRDLEAAISRETDSLSMKLRNTIIDDIEDALRE